MKTMNILALITAILVIANGANAQWDISDNSTTIGDSTSYDYVPSDNENVSDSTTTAGDTSVNDLGALAEHDGASEGISGSSITTADFTSQNYAFSDGENFSGTRTTMGGSSYADNSVADVYGRPYHTTGTAYPIVGNRDSTRLGNGVAPVQTYLGNLSANRYVPNSTSNLYGGGSPYAPNSVNNPYGPYGSRYSSKSANNPYATDTPQLYDSKGGYHGKLSRNPYDPDSVSNPYGRYGSRYSPDSLNNPYGAGSPYAPDSPNNPYGKGWDIIGK